MKEAIQKAIEGGYLKLKDSPTTPNTSFNGKILEYREFNGSQTYEIPIEEILLDPLFWQALGKSLGWYSETPLYQIAYQPAQWAWYWHRFIDHLAEGKDVESFFNDLLK